MSTSQNNNSGSYYYYNGTQIPVTAEDTVTFHTTSGATFTVSDPDWITNPTTQELEMEIVDLRNEIAEIRSLLQNATRD